MQWADEEQHEYRYNIILRCIDIMYTQREEYGKLYSMWLSNKEEEIAEAINVIVYASIDAVANSYSSLIVILNTDLKAYREYEQKMNQLYSKDPYWNLAIQQMADWKPNYKESTIDYLKEIGKWEE